MKSGKPKTDRAVRTTISMPMKIYADAVGRQQARGLNNFSAYIQVLVHNDKPAPHAVHVREAA